MKFDQKIIGEIRKAMEEVSKKESGSLVIGKTCAICTLVRQCSYLCKLHRKDILFFCMFSVKKY